MKYLYLTLFAILSLHFVSSSQNTAKETGKISNWIATAKNKVEVLPRDGSNNSAAVTDALFLTKHTSSITTDADSALNELISDYGGILINNGWIRILGAGCKRLNRSLPEWNKGKSFTGSSENPSYILIADDAVGGFFAINTGGIGTYDLNRVFYYGPNGLKWQTTGLTYSRFMSFCFSGNLADFYSDFFWKGWQEDVKKLSCEEVISCYPLLWTREGKELKCNRKIVSLQEVWNQYHRNDVAEVKKRDSPKANKSHQKGDSYNQAPSLVYQKH